MEPQNDSELRSLLREWKAPEISPSLEARIFRTPRMRSQSWWHTLLRGYIRIPIPVACGLIAVIIAGAWRIARPPIPPCAAAAIQTPARAVAGKTTVCSPDSRC
jgi:hypothetical protein